jgi:hypothetical protein
MSVLRMIVVLGGALVLLLAVVLLRTTTARVHYEISQQEQATVELRRKVRAAELELARLRNPVLLRQQVERALELLHAAARDGGDQE